MIKRGSDRLKSENSFYSIRKVAALSLFDFFAHVFDVFAIEEEVVRKLVRKKPVDG